MNDDQPEASQTTAPTFVDVIGEVECKVLWAAMCAMVKDIHCPQDQLTEGEWLVAEKIFEALDREINRGR